MRIYTKLEFKWENGKYILDKFEYKEYTGNIAFACGASQQQTETYQTQKQITDTMIMQMNAVFGAASSTFTQLVNTFAPIVAAGPSQEGFSPAEKATLESEAITQTGEQYQAAKQAIGEQVAAMGGGNIALPSGAQIAPELALSEKAAAQTAQELNAINLQDYQTGRANWLTAVGGLAGAPSVFNPATGAAGATVGSGSAQGKTATEIAQANNSWVNAAIGALGGVAGAAIGRRGNDQSVSSAVGNLGDYGTPAWSATTPQVLIPQPVPNPMPTSGSSFGITSPEF